MLICELLKDKINGKREVISRGICMLQPLHNVSKMCFYVATKLMSVDIMQCKIVSKSPDFQSQWE